MPTHESRRSFELFVQEPNRNSIKPNFLMNHAVSVYSKLLKKEADVVENDKMLLEVLESIISNTKNLDTIFNHIHQRYIIDLPYPQGKNLK